MKIASRYTGLRMTERIDIERYAEVDNHYILIGKDGKTYIAIEGQGFFDFHIESEI